VKLVPSKLDDPLHWRKPRRVFVNSMSDLFHEALTNAHINEVFAAMARAPQHTFQVLTKRPGRMLDYFRWARVANAACALWPLPHVWLGVSVEDQATADERIPLLLQTPAAKRFVSYEPAIGPVDFARVCPSVVAHGDVTNPERRAALQELARAAYKHVGWQTLDWVIVGGESGPGARPFDVEWARSTIRQCNAAGVASFMKQMGANVRDRNDAGFEGDTESSWPMDTHHEDVDGDVIRFQGDRVRVRLKDPKGGDPAEWPDDLRVREFPA
jgi:protein gp37